MTFDAVLLASFGGPEGPQEVMPFLERVTAGRDVPRERLERVAEHYLALGGVSPINAQNRELLDALRREFASRGIDLPTYWGNRNSTPFYADVLRQMHRDGHRRIVVIVTSAYSSYSGCRQYRENLAQALTETGLEAEMEIVKIRPYSEQAGFAEPFAAGVNRALHALSSKGIEAEASHVLFTTHSIPDIQGRSSGPQDEQRADRPGLYERQHLDAAARVMKAVAATRGAVPTWSLAFQSRSGPPQVPWLGPDVHEALSELASAGTDAAIAVPIGFVSDHVEVLWDLDHEAAATADRVGLDFLRVPTPGTDSVFVAMLADLVDEAVSGTPQEHDATWAGLCSRTCCPNPRVELAAVAGC